MAFKKRKKNIAREDFEESSLPKTRKEQFFDCIKIRYSLLLRVGLVLVLFLVPRFVLMLYRDFTLAGYAAGLDAGSISAEEYQGICFSVEIFVGLINIVCLVIFSVGLSGCARIIRRFVWGQPVFFWSDFLAGLKNNSLSYSIIFLFCGVVRVLATLAESFLSASELARYLPIAAAAVLVLPALLFALSQSAVYKNSAGRLIKNSYILYIKSVPRTLVFVLVLMAVNCFEYIPLLFLKYGLYLLFAVVALPVFILAWSLFSLSLFDKYINAGSFPSLYRRGLYTPD